METGRRQDTGNSGRLADMCYVYAKTKWMQGFKAFDLGGFFAGRLIYASMLMNDSESRERLQRLADEHRGIYRGGRRMNLYREITDIPVLLKEGGVLPLAGEACLNAEETPQGTAGEVPAAGTAGVVAVVPAVHAAPDLIVGAPVGTRLAEEGETQVPEGRAHGVMYPVRQHEKDRNKQDRACHDPRGDAAPVEETL